MVLGEVKRVDSAWFYLSLVGAATALLVLLFRLKKRSRQLNATQSDLATERGARAAEHSEWSQSRRAFESEIARLSKWQGVADADAKATELLQHAEEVLKRARTEADAVTAVAKQQTETLLTETNAQVTGALTTARQDAKKLKDQAQAMLDSAALQAKAVVDAAEKRAGEIAGSAYEAMNKAALFEQTVAAMKNLIDGYGDRYLVPERSILDDLAEDFGHVEAGVQLKAARESSTAMVRSDTAATCEYVEANRRTTAIRFVIDAFNGKVDSILSRVKHDNVGTLEQEIRDAFTLVNYNGKAFRDARIRREYLDARLAELKWAAVVQQLRQDEKEEQRRIKEQIRDEERARREYERALKEAARDEELLRKAMEKALQKVQQATDAQKAIYEQQLEDLSEKLRQAEERSQRALSMAQQTKRGHVYIISNVGSFGPDVYKIGLTRRLEPLDRVRELGDCSVPFEFDVHALIFSEDAPALETQLHKHFVLMQMNKVNYRKEFFRVGVGRVRDEVEKLGLNAKWTLTAAAREYRETLAIERAIKDDPVKREAWVKRQLELEPVDYLEDEAEATFGV
jgi:hypothetical protein